MKFSRIQSAQVSGLTAQRVTIETDVHRGLYLFQIVGLPDKAVAEARERVISALRNSLEINVKAENHKVVVSLSPAEQKKEGAYFDLAIAVGYLVATEAIEFSKEYSRALFLGELSLNGDVRPIRGLLAISELAKEAGITTLFIPEANADEAALVDGITFFLVPTLSTLVQHMRGSADKRFGESVSDEPLSIARYTGRTLEERPSEFDIAQVRGQALAKRALVIAASGGHNIVLYGPPGTGKTMLARAFHSIIPALDEDAFLEVATIYSSIGLFDTALSMQVPIRAPHHSASHTAVIGGGSSLRPGDITLAHRGVLYMDEFPEFDRRVIEALREPLEEGAITIARAKGSVRFPAQFILLAAMNPCPCGYRGSTIKVCTCSGQELMRYKKKLSGPMVDRIDLWVPVEHVSYASLHADASVAQSPIVQGIVGRARARARRRTRSQKSDHTKTESGKLNSALSTSEIHAVAFLSSSAKNALQYAAEKLKLSPRAYIRTIKVARTIADLDESDATEERHVLEALQFRQKLEY